MRRATLMLAACGGMLCAASAAEARPNHRVFGYASGGTMPARWDLVTDVAYFAEQMGTDGSLPTTGWSTSGKALVTAGHANGARVVMTVMLFNTSTTDKIHTFLSTASAVQAGTTNIVNAVKSVGGDGVDLDFEFVSGTDKAAFTSFVQGLASAMHAAIPGSDVSIAMPSEAYPGYDLAALGQAADTLMIMGYDYHWASSDPGPVSPLADSALWGKNLSQGYTIGLFKANVPPSKLVMGMPLYGYDYHATSTTIPGKRVTGTTASAVEYKTAEVDAPLRGRKWDTASSTPYYVYTDDAGARQAFYDDAESLGLKIDQAFGAGLAGIGLWALGYESSSFWTMLEPKVTDPPDAGTDASAPPTPLDAGAPLPADDAGPLQDTTSASDSGGCSVSAVRSAASWPFLLLALLLVKRRLSFRAAPRE